MIKDKTKSWKLVDKDNVILIKFLSTDNTVEGLPLCMVLLSWLCECMFIHERDVTMYVKSRTDLIFFTNKQLCTAILGISFEHYKDTSTSNEAMTME